MSTRFHLIFQRFILFYLWLNRGAGQEVGRSCIMLEFKGKKIMVNKYQNRVYLTSIKLTSSSHLTAGLWNPSWSFWNGCIAFCGLDWGRSNWFATYFTVIIIIFKVFFCSAHLFNCHQFPFGPLWSTSLVLTENNLQRQMFYDSCHKSNLSLVAIWLHQGKNELLKVLGPNFSCIDDYYFVGQQHFHRPNALHRSRSWSIHGKNWSHKFSRRERSWRSSFLGIQCWPRSWCCYVYDWNCRRKSAVHWRLFPSGRQTFNGGRNPDCSTRYFNHS